jgi:hypothetical protein
VSTAVFVAPVNLLRIFVLMEIIFNIYGQARSDLPLHKTRGAADEV